jgi:hypothetical protein
MESDVRATLVPAQIIAAISAASSPTPPNATRPFPLELAAVGVFAPEERRQWAVLR